MAKRRKYTEEFKLEAVRMVTEQGLSVSQVAADLGVDRSLISSWKKKVDEEGAAVFRGNGRRRPEEEELRRLRRELSVAQQERDILKKALAYFAKHKN